MIARLLARLVARYRRPFLAPPVGTTVVRYYDATGSQIGAEDIRRMWGEM